MEDAILNQLKTKYGQNGNGGGGKFNFFSFDPGENTVRILRHPSLDDSNYTLKIVYMHWNLPEPIKRMVCPRFTHGMKYCGVCDFVRELDSTKDPLAKKFADNVRKKMQVFYNILDLNESTPTVKILKTGIKVWESIKEIAFSKFYSKIFDLEEGRNLIISFKDASKSQSGWNEYKVIVDPTPSPVRDVDLSGLVDLSIFCPLEAEEKGIEAKAKLEEIFHNQEENN